mmetsp:Transcript_19991/g.45535  ORF Transcript_19991/g.45535 Transcript_19991/m.45535 type:complete len:110 (+) Transcript_19991:688-1017(+)
MTSCLPQEILSLSQSMEVCSISNQSPLYIFRTSSITLSVLNKSKLNKHKQPRNSNSNSNRSSSRRQRSTSHPNTCSKIYRPRLKGSVLHPRFRSLSVYILKLILSDLLR